jgi:DNA-binding NarL/FixJ family response regulator
MVTALLVDDHPLFCDGFASMLRRHRTDWTLTVANFAAEALEIVRRDQPDLAIIDIQLPDMDGFNAARGIALRAPLVSRVMISGRQDVGRSCI